MTRSNLQSCETHPHTITESRGCCRRHWLPSHTSSPTSRVHKKAAFVGSMNLSPRRKIPPVAIVLLCVLMSKGVLIGLMARRGAVFSRILTVFIEMALLGIQFSLKIVLLEKEQPVAELRGARGEGGGRQFLSQMYFYYTNRGAHIYLAPGGKHSCSATGSNIEQVVIMPCLLVEMFRDVVTN